MKKTLIAAIIFCTTGIFNQLNAQNVTVTKGGIATFTIEKGTKPLSMIAGSNRFFTTETYKSVAHNYVQTGFDAEGKYMNTTKIEIAGGEFKNSFTIKDVVSFGSKNYALIENTNKTTGKNILLAREIDKDGKVATEETEMMNFAFEKLMNSGFTYISVSPDQSKMAVLALLPYEKDVSAKCKVNIFDQQLKKTKEIEFSLPGEDKKNKSVYFNIANDGTVYILKRTYAKNGEIELTVLMWNEKTSSFSEYAIDLGAPMYPTSFSTVVNDANELIVAGVYRKRVTLSAGEPLYQGVFYYCNKGKTENILKMIEAEKEIENLEMRNVIPNGDLTYILTEQYKSVRDDVPANTTTVDYSYTYTRQSNFVFGINNDGTKKFQIELAKTASSRNIDLADHTAYFICGGKLTAVYNDDYKKYNTNSYGRTPVLVQITNDGLMNAPVVINDKVKLEYPLYPAFGVKDSDNQISLMAGNGTGGQLVIIKIE